MGKWASNLENRLFEEGAVAKWILEENNQFKNMLLVVFNNDTLDPWDNVTKLISGKIIGCGSKES